MDVDLLSSAVSKDEVRRALFDMHPSKSPGFDVFPAAFFQKAWSVTGDHLFLLVKNAMERGSFNQELNRTLIILIPKIE